jgi:uncharacterized protein (TIGR02453 family)
MLAAIEFLRALERHNDREWFAKHKERYISDVQEPMRSFLTELTDECARLRIPLHGDVRRSIFRIYRDIRFTPDKRPFKTWAAAYLSHDGERKTSGGFYIRISPEASWMSLAFYMPPPAALMAWRRAMAERPAQFARIVSALAKHKLKIAGPEEWDDSLARMPRGFEGMAKSPLAPYFRIRSFAVRRPLRQADLKRASLVKPALQLIEDGGPLLRFGWQITEGAIRSDERTTEGREPRRNF